MRLAFMERGSGTPLVLLHGMFGDYLDWAPVVDPLAAHFRVLAPDLPGFGDSDKPDAEFTRELFTSALDEFLLARGVDRCVLAGNSFGGQIAMEYARSRPGRVHQLVLIDSGGFYRYSPAERAATIARMPEAWLNSIDGATFRKLFEPLFVTPSEESEAYIAKQAAKPARADWPDLVRCATRSIRLHTEMCVLDDLEQIVFPVLLIWGENDRVVPVDQARIALPGFHDARLLTLPSCGHVPQIECPAAVVEAINRFAAGIPTAA
jgi:2-hydroxy-6-oxonona-2,4-dienedioate hydrolase